MNPSELKNLLDQLQQELESAHGIAPELRAQLAALDHDIQKVLAEDAPGDDAPLTARAQEIDARFSADHPALAASLRNMMDALGKMGI